MFVCGEQCTLNLVGKSILTEVRLVFKYSGSIILGYLSFAVYSEQKCHYFAQHFGPFREMFCSLSSL